MQNVWIGVDVAKDNCEVALKPDGATRSFPCTEAGVAAMLMWASSLPGFQGHIAMEATGIYSQRLAVIMLEQGAVPAIINPAHIHSYGRSFGRRNKTDKIDARLITRFANERQPREWEAPSAAVEALRTLLQQRESAVQELNRLRSQISSMVIPHPLLLKHVDSTESYIAELEEEMKKIEESDPVLAAHTALVRTIPGIGVWSSRAIIAYLGDLRRFSRRSIASFVGLAPCVYHSGSFTGGGHIPHTGPPLLKKYLYMAAQTQTQPRMKNPIAQYYHHLRSNSKTGKQSLCAIMRKFLLIARALIITQTPYNPELHREASMQK